jgi:uncharacterized membrane protein YbhN (UPF0104 family)
MRRLETLSALLRAVDTRIGWSRIGMAASAAVVAGALFILYQMLQHIDVGRVIAAIRATPPQTIQLAGLFVAAGYVTLTFYDYFALRWGQLFSPAGLCDCASIRLGGSVSSTWRRSPS